MRHRHPLTKMLINLPLLVLVAGCPDLCRGEASKTENSNAGIHPDMRVSFENADRSIGSDFRKGVWRVPSVFKGQFLSWDGLRIFLYSGPFLAISFLEERAVSDWCRENRIPEDSGADVFLDALGGVVYPIAFIPIYALARSIKDDRMADLAVDLTTFTLVCHPELIAVRYIGDRPRPNGERDFIFGLEACSSFPSGHTAAAVGVARLAHYHYGPWVGVPLYLLAAAIGYQRLGAGEHYLADVVGGAMLGLSVADAVVRERRKEREGSEARKQLSVQPMVGGRHGALGIAVSWDF